MPTKRVIFTNQVAIGVKDDEPKFPQLKMVRFVEILKEFGLNDVQIEDLWISKPCAIDEETLRSVVSRLAPLMIEASSTHRTQKPEPTREEQKRSLESRYYKARLCCSKERATT